MGWFVAIFLIAPVIVFLINLLFFSPKNDMERNVVDQYIGNSIEMDIRIAERPLIINKSILISTGLRQVFQRTQLQSATYRSFTVYGSEYGKYFTVIVVGAGNSINFQYTALYSLVPGALIKARVNKDDLNNPVYGTKENPIPILMLDIPSLRGWKDYDEEAITEEQYATAVYYYLGYIMLKDEFKQRFSTQTQ